MSRILWIVLWCVVAGVVVANGCFLVAEAARWWKAGGADGDKGDEASAPPRVESAGGVRYIKLNEKLADSYGLETEKAQPWRWRETVIVNGRVVANPQATYEVRVPFAGVLRAADTAWPAPGQVVRAGEVLGKVAARVAPQDRLDLQSRLSEALSKQKAATEVVALRSEIAARLEKASTGVVVQKDLDEAKVQLAEARAELATATAAVALWRQALDDLDGARGADGVWSRPLVTPADVAPGAQLEVVELGGRPGEAVEAGGLAFRLADVNRPLIRFDFPAEVLRAGPLPKTVEATSVVAWSGDQATTEDAPVRATLVGPAGQVDAASQFVGYFYDVQAAAGSVAVDKEAGRVLRSVWRPGLFVQTRLPTSAGEPEDATAVPAGALLYHEGRKLVYVRREPDKYEKREVRVLGWEGDRCILARHGALDPTWLGVEPGEVVVSDQAQVLLATEFRQESDND